MTVLLDVLADRAAGRIDDEGLDRIARLHSLLHHGKEASATTGAATTIGQRILEGLARGIEQSVAPLAVGLGITAAAVGGRALVDRATRNSDLERILQVYPHLKEYDRKDIELAYSSMRHMNPHIAKDPLAGGTLLGQMLRSRDPMNPKVLRFEPQLAGDLLRLSPKEEHAFEEVARDAVMRGMASGADEASRNRQMLGQQAFQQTMEDGKRTFERERDDQRARATSSAAAEERAHRERMAERERAAKTKSEGDARKHQMGIEVHKAKLKERAETGRRFWETGQKRDDHVAQDRRAVLSAMLGKAGPDQDWYAAPIIDQTTGQPMFDPQTGQPYAEHQFMAPPQISAMLGGQSGNPWVNKHYPHLRP